MAFLLGSGATQASTVCPNARSEGGLKSQRYRQCRRRLELQGVSGCVEQEHCPLLTRWRHRRRHRDNGLPTGFRGRPHRLSRGDIVSTRPRRKVARHRATPALAARPPTTGGGAVPDVCGYSPAVAFDGPEMSYPSVMMVSCQRAQHLWPPLGCLPGGGWRCCSTSSRS